MSVTITSVNVSQIVVSSRLRLKSIFSALFRMPLSNGISVVFSMYLADGASESDEGFPLRWAARYASTAD